MTLVRPESGIHAGASRNFGLDVGFGIVNGNLAELFDVATNPASVITRMRNNTWIDPEGVEQTPRKLGVTKGGFQYNPGVTQRNVEADGKRGMIREWWRIDEISPTVKVNLLEVRDPDTFQKYMGACDRATVGYYERLTPRMVVDELLDFWWNLVLIQTIAGQALPKLIIIRNPHVSQQEALDHQDKTETVLPVTFTGNYYEDDAYGETEPAAEVWMPNQSVS